MPINRRVLRAYIENQLDPIVRRIVLELFTSLVKYTPVDTGRARAGWNVQKGNPATDVPPIPSVKRGRGGRVTSGRLRAPITRSLQGFSIDDKWFITNSVEYIEVLDRGRSYRDGQLRGSRQAPRGMTLLAINDLRRALRRAGIRVTGNTRNV